MQEPQQSPIFYMFCIHLEDTTKRLEKKIDSNLAIEMTIKNAFGLLTKSMIL